MKLPSGYDLGSIEMFVLTAELGGMTQTARHLGMTQSAVSQTISKLEASLHELSLAHVDEFHGYRFDGTVGAERHVVESNRLFRLVRSSTPFAPGQNHHQNRDSPGRRPPHHLGSLGGSNSSRTSAVSSIRIARPESRVHPSVSNTYLSPALITTRSPE